MSFLYSSQKFRKTTHRANRAVERVWMEALEGRVLLSMSPSPAVLVDMRGTGPGDQSFAAEAGKHYRLIKWGYDVQATVAPYGTHSPQGSRIIGRDFLNELEWTPAQSGLYTVH